MMFTSTLIVTDENIDELDHVNNITYIKWILDVAKRHWESETSKDLRNKIVWVVLSHYIEYKAPAHLGDELIIETWVENYSATRSERYTRIKNHSTGCVLVSALTTWCPISRQSMRPTRITTEMVDPFTI